MKRIAIAGATGLIGTRLTSLLLKRGYETVIISTNAKKAKEKFPKAVKTVSWGEVTPDALEGCSAIVNLAGANVAGQKWSSDYKKELISSRIDTTRELYDAVEKMGQKPSAFICSSAVGYYGDGGESELDESGKKGNGFLADLCEQWENEAAQFKNAGLRVASIRTGVVLDPSEGALKKMLLPFKLGIGGPLGNGRQWFPWIHIDDIVGIYLFTLENEINGVYNGTAPEPVRMKDFASAMGKVMKRPSLFPVPAFVLQLIMGESAGIVLEGQRAIPAAIQKAGFKFQYHNLKDALHNLLG
ncbi:MAG: TIGR01777 family protein [Ignavibacteriaceae bacterium]|nr:TIGR01777 family protein [Ignavibacteriaceae bacterium]